MQSLFQDIQNLSLHEKKSLLQRMVKLQEECGELAQEVLIHTNASGSQYKEKKEDTLKKECVDILLVVLSIYFQEKGSVDELFSLLYEKKEKWKKHQQ